MPCPSAWPRGGWNDPMSLIVPDAIETLVALGELELASNVPRPVLGRSPPEARARLQRCRDARCRGLLAGAKGDLDSAFAAFEHALAPASQRRTDSSGRARCSASAPSAARRSRRRPREEALGAGARDIRRARRPPLGGESTRRAGSDQRPLSRLRGADRDRTPRRRTCRPGPHQQADRRRALHGREYRRVPPVPRLPQARRPPRRARRQPGAGGGADDRRHHRARRGARPRSRRSSPRSSRAPARSSFPGEAGIGKTSPLGGGSPDGRGHACARVLACRGVEAEASLSFAGLSDLLAPVLDDVVPSLLPPRRRALEVALLLAEPGETAARSARDRARRARRAARAGRAKARCSSRSTMLSGSIPPPPGRSRSRCAACATSRVGLLATLRKGSRARRVRSSSSARFPDERLEQI